MIAVENRRSPQIAPGDGQSGRVKRWAGVQAERVQHNIARRTEPMGRPQRTPELSWNVTITIKRQKKL